MWGAAIRILAVCAAISFLGASTAQAQHRSAAQVEAGLREQGREALREGRFQDALSAFQQAAFQSRDPGTWLEVADAADRLRENDAALDAYRRYLSARPNAPDQREVAARVAVLQRVVGHGHGRPLVGEAARRGLMPARPMGSDPPRPRLGEAGRRGIISAAEIVDAIRRGQAGRRLSSPAGLYER